MIDAERIESLAPMVAAYTGMSKRAARRVSMAVLIAVDDHPVGSIEPVAVVSLAFSDSIGIDDVDGAHDALVQIATGIVNLGDAMADYNRAAPAPTG